MVALADLVKKEGPLSAAQVKKVRKWLEDDWESHDVDREAVALIRRLVETVEAAPAPRKPLSKKAIREALERGAKSADELEKTVGRSFRGPKSDQVLR
jgi:hypothetical protein